MGTLCRILECLMRCSLWKWGHFAYFWSVWWNILFENGDNLMTSGVSDVIISLRMRHFADIWSVWWDVLFENGDNLLTSEVSDEMFSLRMGTLCWLLECLMRCSLWKRGHFADFWSVRWDVLFEKKGHFAYFWSVWWDFLFENGDTLLTSGGSDEMFALKMETLCWLLVCWLLECDQTFSLRTTTFCRFWSVSLNVLFEIGYVVWTSGVSENNK